MALPTTRPAFENLGSRHDRKAFDCGEASLNNYLQRYARQNADRNLGITHVVVSVPGAAKILGYYTLLARHINRELFPDPRGLTPDGVGVVLLGRLAVDQTAQGQGIGTAILSRAIHQTEVAASQIGIKALVVHALTDRARDWYAKFGFEPLQDDPHHLYLTVELIRTLVANDGNKNAG